MKYHFLSLGIFSIILLFVYRSLFLNISTNLPDWLDYALVNWLIFQNIDKIIHLNFVNFFDTNAFYPNKYTFFFADTFLPQSIITLPFYFLFKNYVLSFNISFFITLILDYFSGYLFWKYIFKDFRIGILGGLLTFFSPFYHLEYSHVQMLFYWPFFITFYFIFKFESEKRLKYILLAAFFFCIQFLASVYIFIFLCFSLGIFFFIKYFIYDKKIFTAKSIVIITLVFILLDGIFVKGYFDMKKKYNFQRDFKEYITYSANLTDYLFTNRIHSILYSQAPFKIWNNLDKNTLWGSAQFPGFLVTILGLFGIFKFQKNKEKLVFNFSITKDNIFFLSLVLIGFTFSLGPRIIFNNTYSHLPSIYAIFLKILPFLESIRAVCRWSFLFYIGLIYFSLTTVSNLKIKYKNVIFLLFMLIIILEYVPFNLTSYKDNIINSDYMIIRDICSSNKKILLEIPVTHLDVYPGIGEGVNYISKVEFSSIYHKCYLVNGYSGYDLRSLFILKDNLYKSIIGSNPKAFIKFVKDAQADIIKINKDQLPLEVQTYLPSFLNELGKQADIKLINNNVYLLK